MNDSLQFDKGIMRLSAYDPLSNQYETRILTLPELPLLESLEHLFDSNTVRPALRMTKSCSNKKSVITRSNSVSNLNNLPRRCQSNPNLSKKQQQQKKPKIAGGHIRSKRSLSSAFNAVAGFIQKAANKKTRSQQWSKETWVDEIRLSRSSSISSFSKSSSFRNQYFDTTKTCENWWMSSPPVSSF
ncbi:unnamed protein product [Mucor hiemalis]